MLKSRGRIQFIQILVAGLLFVGLAGPARSGGVMEMQGPLEVYDKNEAGGIGKVSLLSASSTNMIPLLMGSSEHPHYGLFFISTPDDAIQTGFTKASFFYSARVGSGWGTGPVTTGNLFRIDNYTTQKFVIDHAGKVGILTSTPVYTLDVTGTFRASGNGYINGGAVITSERRHKTNIEDAFVLDSETLHQSLRPRKYLRKWERFADLPEGAPPLADGETTPTETTLARHSSWGLIIDELPEQFVKTGEEGDENLYIDPMDFVTLNIKVIQKQRQAIKTLKNRLVAVESGEGLTLENWTPGDSALESIVAAVITEIESGDWVEIPAAEAWEEVPETTAVEVTQTVTRYRFNPATRQAEPYQTEVTQIEQQPTGATIVQLKPDVRLDAETGLFYQRQPLVPETTAAATALLRSLLAARKAGAGEEKNNLHAQLIQD